MTDEPSTQLAPRPPVQSGGALAALVPQNLDDAFRLAKALSSAGDMVPKHFQGKPEMTMAAIVRGMEIGLAPMQALSNIAVINGRASVWGDALPALMQRAGHEIDVAMVGEDDNAKAVATLTRGDTGRAIVREFSVADAKKAQLWGKAGPWQQYPKRMLANRARAWACRDGAADALMGLQVAEEVSDYAKDVTPRDVTPRASGFAAKALGARPPLPEPTQETQPPEDAEVVHWTEAIDPENGFPGSDAYTAGAQAFAKGVLLVDCPETEGTQEAVDWVAGWRGAEKAGEQG